MSEAVAVVVPCRDLGRTLPEALESVRAQTAPAAELVVVDDGSTDPLTLGVLARLEGEGVRVVRIAHAGLGAARNAGVRATTAPLLACLDADDVLEPAYIETTTARLGAEPGLAFVTTGMRAFGGADYVWTPEAPTLAAILGGSAPHASTLLRRSLFDALGGFDEALPTCEDQDFWARAAAAGARGAVLAEPLLRYRVRPGSLYHASLGRGTHAATTAALLRRHREAVEALGPELLVQKERRLWALRAHGDHLRRLRAERVAQLDRLHAEVRALRASLAEKGRPALDLGDLGRTEPLSAFWGLERGRPLDRLWIERFLDRHRADVRGRVLEVKDSGYTDWFGAGVTEKAVLDVDPGNPKATIVGDLARPETLPRDRFDCFILTQTLHIVYEVRAALAGALQVLRPGGTLLATVPALSRVNPEDGGLDGGDFWRFTEASLRRMLGELLPPDRFEVRAHGNVLACAAFLYGLSPDELDPAQLEKDDPWFPLVFTIRAVKPERPAARKRCTSAAAVLLYHRVGLHAPDVHGLCTAPARFRAHLDFLRRECRPMPLEALVEAAADGSLPERAVAVTFDDGGLDGLVTASPLLLAAGVPATFFVNGESLERPAERWWDLLERVLLGDGPLPEELALALDGQELRWPTGTDAQRRRAHDDLHERLREGTIELRVLVAERLARWCGRPLPDRDSHRPMSAAEVRELAGRRGHEVGSHTQSHLWLPAQRPDVRRREIEDGARALERLLGRRPRAIAYPYGAFDDATVEEARAAGHVLGVTVEGGPLREGVDAMRVPRVEAGDLERDAFAERMNQLFG